MEEGYYWVRDYRGIKEVWFYNKATPEGWFEPTVGKPVTHSEFIRLGHSVVCGPISFEPC